MTDLMVSLDLYFIKYHSNTLDQVIYHSNQIIEFLSELKDSQNNLKGKEIVTIMNIIDKTKVLISDLSEENMHFVKKINGKGFENEV